MDSGGGGGGGAEDMVVLVHGLARQGRSMAGLASRLRENGFDARILSYPSRRFPTDVLVRDFLAPQIVSLCQETGGGIQFVTHSMGGILVGKWMNGTAHPDERARVTRVVMLAPPIHGCEIVDRMGSWFVFKLFNGPAGLELGTDRRHFVTVPVETGVIAGTKSQPVLGWMLPSPNDGKVSVATTRLTGMVDFRTVPFSHTFIMNKHATETHVISFLRHGRFA